MATLTLSRKQWPFAPQCINNCILWLDAADTSTYTPSSSISTWRNKGYAGGSATTTSGTVSSTSADINGLPAMNFATNSYMTAPSMTYTQTTRTAFVVVNIGSTGVNRYYLVQGSANYVDTALNNYYSGSYTDIEFSYYTHVNYQTTTPYPIFNTTSIICGTTLSTNGGIFVNGLAQTPYAINSPLAYGTGTTTTQLIGYSATGSFVLGEVMIFDGAITDIQRQQVEGYLAAKWGLQSLLPPTHPYFTLSNLTVPTFAPTEIPTCTLWLDASDASSVVGTSVYQWNDKSGNANHATATSGNPTLTPNALNSKSVLTFGGSAYMTSPLSMSTTGPLTYFCVAKPSAGGFIAVSAINGGGANNRPNTLMMYESSSGYWWFSGGTGAVDGNTVTLATSTSRYDINANYWSPNYTQVNINGVSYASSSSSPSSLASGGTFLVGRASGPATEYWNGTIAEIIVYNVTLTTAQRQAVEAYLGAKWNIPVTGQGTVAPVANPLTISGCQLWLDAADATTIVPVVSTWQDKSGLGYNLAAGTGSTIYTNFGPGPSIKLNTSYLYVNKAVDLTQYTVFSVLLSQTGISNQPTVTGRPNSSASYSSSDGFGLYVDAGGPQLRFYGTNTTTNNSTTSTTISQPLVLASYTCTSAGFVSSWINGVTGTTTSTGVSRTNTGQGFSVGGEWSGSVYVSQSGTGCVSNVYEVIVYNSVLTTTQRQKVENYLLAKWGTGRNFWIDASDATTVTKATNVLTWTDKSGNGNNATAVGKPVLTANAINGIQAMYLADAPYFLGSVSITTTTLTCFAVATTNLTLPNTRGRDQRLVSLENLTNVDYGRTDGTIALFNQGTTSTIATYRVSGPLANNAITTGTPFLAVSQYTGANAYLWYNGTAGTSTGGASSGSFGITKYGIGNQANPSGETWNGYIGEVIIYNTALTDTQRQQIQTYLGNKWGLTVSNQTAGIINPTLIPGCVLWLDAADSTSIVTSVSQINDKSGNGYNITQSTATYQPALTNNYLTLGTSLNSYMNMPQAAINNTSNWTLFLVFNPISTNNWIFVKQFDGNDTYNILSMGYSQYGTSGTAGVVYFKALNSGTLFTGPAALTTSTNQLLTMIYNGSNIYYYINGILSAITNGTFTIQSQTGATNATIGEFIVSGAITNSGVTNFLLGELDFYNLALSTAQTQQIEAYLMNKWSITNTVQTANGSLVDTPFLPTDIAGCVVWYDGADTSSMTMTGTAVTTWKDKSGNGYNATGYNSPAYVISTGGVSFNAASTQYFTMSVPYYKTNTMFMVASPVPSSTSAMYYMNTSVGNAGSFFLGGYNSSYICAYFPEDTVPEPVFSAGLPTNPFVVCLTKTSGATYTGYYNGVQVFTGTESTTDTASTWAWLGGAGVISGTFYNALTATIYELVIYNSALSTAQIAKVNSYLQRKWNTALTVTTIPTPVYNRPFQPVDITGCLLWLDAYDLTTLFQNTAGTTAVTAAGQQVQYWADKSGNANNATSSETAMTYNTSGIGYPSIYFSGSQTNGLRTNVVVTDSTYFYVVYMTQTSGVYVFSGHQGPTHLKQNYTINNLLQMDYSGIGGIGGSVGMNTTTIVTRQDTSSSGLMAGWQNGASIGSKSMGVTGETFTQLSLGVDYPSGFTGILYMSEVIIYNSVLSTGQRQQVEAYLAWKYGLISSLASGHPGRTLPSFSTVFTPKSISGLTLWMDAADASTMVFSSGTNVSIWRDKSGSGNNFNTVAGTLTYTTTTTGNPGIFFPSGSSGMTSTSNAAVNGNASRTYFFVADVPASCRALIGTGPMQTTSPPNTLGFDSSKSANTIWSPFVYAGADITFTPVAATTTINYAAYNSANSTLYGNYNTTSSDTTRSTTLNTSATVWYLGNRPDGNTPINSYICEFIEFNSYLTTSQRQQVEGYLAWKWGVQSALPVSHAYNKFKP